MLHKIYFMNELLKIDQMELHVGFIIETNYIRGASL